MKFARIHCFAVGCLACSSLVSPGMAAETSAADSACHREPAVQRRGLSGFRRARRRGVGTKGLDLAADYIADQFREIGLKTELYDGGPFQKFKMTTGASLGPRNELTLIGPAAEGGETQQTAWKLGQQFNPLASAARASSTCRWCSSATESRPRTRTTTTTPAWTSRARPSSSCATSRSRPIRTAFSMATRTPQYAPFQRKVSNAYEHGAAAVIFVTDDFDIRKTVEAAAQTLANSGRSVGRGERQVQAAEESRSPRPRRSTSSKPRR